MSKPVALQPLFNVGDVVAYTDRHGRAQSGKVRSVRGNWFSNAPHCKPYLVYELQHPTYRGGRFYCGESDIKGYAGEGK